MKNAADFISGKFGKVNNTANLALDKVRETSTRKLEVVNRN